MRLTLALAALLAVATTSVAQPRTAAVNAARRTAAATDAHTAAMQAPSTQGEQSASAQQGQPAGATVEQKQGAVVTPPADSAKGTAKALPMITREIYQYDGGGRRDPMLSLIRTKALRPNIAELELLFTVVGGASSRATIYDMTAKEKYLVKVGDMIGRYRVIRIQDGVVTFEIEEFGYSRQERLVKKESNKERNQ